KPLLSRADYLGYLMMRFRTRVGISGMHGKSTCTSMCARIFTEAGDPTILCGAEFAEAGHSSCRIGQEQDTFVFEACEYMDSFLDFNPTLAVILNVGMDHVDYFHSMEQIRTSFLRFAERTGKGGRVLYNGDDDESVCAMEDFAGEKITFGLKHCVDFRAERISFEKGVTSFDFYHRQGFLCRISLPACGKHNVYNGLAAASAAVLCGISPDVIAKALATFQGAKRRMEYKGEWNGALIYEDYGHHPDEIKATLAGARQMEAGRILCAYQPHTYSRTAGLLKEFSCAFGDADRVFLVDIYAAREQNIYGVDSGLLARRIGERARYCGSFKSTADAIREEVRPGDLVIVMGAGDVFHVLEELFGTEPT
ncbi:MAG: UDP-N-acetylmuramate--L-alanine ligase, partial [Clostridia bacterium]|nr:UDP-N-acetylmuramate--L-alanine ligase [Clostridia bacterium]